MVVATDKSESGIIDALAYLLDYAEKEKKPIAINLSMGTVIGFKDGTDPIASMIDELLDKSGKKCLMAIAAGNEGHRNSTIVTEATGQGEVINTSFTPPSHMRENIFIGCSTTSAFQVTLSLVGSDGVAFERLFARHAFPYERCRWFAARCEHQPLCPVERRAKMETLSDGRCRKIHCMLRLRGT